MGASKMEMVRVRSLEDYLSFPINKYGIRQPDWALPVRANALDAGRLDVVVVPALALSPEGLRLGHGRGYYDSFLHQCGQLLPSRPYTIGLALTQQIVPNIPVSHLDYTLDSVIYKHA